VRPKLPSPALVLSFVALFAAFAGGAIAGKITGSQIKNGSITGNDIKNDSLTGADIKAPSSSTHRLTTPCQARDLAGSAKDTGRNARLSEV
jgi:hypothetical protein